MTGEVQSCPCAPAVPYISSRGGGAEPGSLCSKAVTRATGGDVQTLGDRALRTHVEAHINQRTWGCRPPVRTDASRTATRDVPGDGPSKLTPALIAAVNQTLTSPARELISVWRRSNLNHSLICWKMQCFQLTVQGFETGALVPGSHRAVTS